MLYTQNKTMFLHTKVKIMSNKAYLFSANQSSECHCPPFRHIVYDKCHRLLTVISFQPPSKTKLKCIYQTDRQIDKGKRFLHVKSLVIPTSNFSYHVTKRTSTNKWSSMTTDHQTHMRNFMSLIVRYVLPSIF